MEEACGNSGVWPSEERMQSILPRITSYSPCLSFFHYPCLPFSPAEVPLAQPHLLCPVNPLQTLLSIHVKHMKYIYFFSYALLLCFRARFSYPCLISSRRATNAWWMLNLYIHKPTSGYISHLDYCNGLELACPPSLCLSGLNRPAKGRQFPWLDARVMNQLQTAESGRKGAGWSLMTATSLTLLSHCHQCPLPSLIKAKTLKWNSDDLCRRMT